MLDTDQLRSFLAIVDTGSFTRAADRVNKTQSAVSMHVRRLEERLDRPLFVKHGRGTRLSPDGERLVDHARLMLQVEAAVRGGCECVILSDKLAVGESMDASRPPIPPLLAVGTVHHHLIRAGEGEQRGGSGGRGAGAFGS